MLLRKERKKLLLWIYARRHTGKLWFNGRRKSLVAGLNWNPSGLYQLFLKFIIYLCWRTLFFKIAIAPTHVKWWASFFWPCTLFLEWNLIQLWKVETLKVLNGFSWPCYNLSSFNLLTNTKMKLEENERIKNSGIIFSRSLVGHA